MSGAIKIIRKVKLDKKLITVVKIIEQTPNVKRDNKLHFKKTQRRGWVSTKWGPAINTE